MNPTIREKLSKVYLLVQFGSEGEKQAAAAALDRLMKKYDIPESELATIAEKDFRFTYSTKLDLALFLRLIYVLFPDKTFRPVKYVGCGKKQTGLRMEYLDYVALESSYEYFRRHMKAEYKRIVAPKVSRRRTAKTRNQTKAELDQLFFDQYTIASGLYREGDVRQLSASEMSKKELRQRIGMQGIKGGKCRTQVTTGLYLKS